MKGGIHAGMFNFFSELLDAAEGIITGILKAFRYVWDSISGKKSKEPENNNH